MPGIFGQPEWPHAKNVWWLSKPVSLRSLRSQDVWSVSPGRFTPLRNRLTEQPALKIDFISRHCVCCYAFHPPSGWTVKNDLVWSFTLPDGFHRCVGKSDPSRNTRRLRSLPLTSVRSVNRGPDATTGAEAPGITIGRSAHPTTPFAAAHIRRSVNRNTVQCFHKSRLLR